MHFKNTYKHIRMVTEIEIDVIYRNKGKEGREGKGKKGGKKEGLRRVLHEPMMIMCEELRGIINSALCP